ncbi:MAG: hypothetical protein C5B54_02600, partial [Acidobacteria bacterium]
MTKRSVTLFVLFIVALVGIWCIPAESANSKKQTQGQPQSTLRPQIIHSLKVMRTKPLRELKPIRKLQGETGKEIENRVMPKAFASAAKRITQPAIPLRNAPVTNKMPDTFIDFEGTDNLCGCLPPDTNGDVGPNHYVQVVNEHIQVFDKTGTSLLGPETIATLWQGFGGGCENDGFGDPIALYDHLADRWLISQFAFPPGSNHQCVAISVTGDPTGSYFLYDFNLGQLVNDYPHFGVWPDGYYMTDNQFNGNSWAGAGVYAFERSKMLTGDPAQIVYFDLFTVDQNFGGMLPNDLDGPAPDVGTPATFAEVDDDSVFGTDRISLWQFHVDWNNTANSTFGISGEPNIHLDTDPFDWNMCNFNRDCIPQPNTSQGLDAITDRLMHRLQYRNINGVAYLVGNHTVDVDGNDHAGVDWFQLKNDGSGWVINNQGIYAPDSDNRWMGSAAMDSAGNIAIGFSVSSSNTFPSIRYTGRLASDPAGQMSQGENSIIEGTGSQTSFFARWGDYSGLVVDNTIGANGGIDCDFWYTTEYLQQTSDADWKTHVGAFSFAPSACGGPHGDIHGKVTDNSTTDPIVGATVKVSPGGFATTTDAGGNYHFTLGVGNYDITASKYGYIPKTNSGVAVTDGGDTPSDFALDLAPHVTVSGTVTDGSGHGWPLYARIDITGYPGGPVFTNPSDGTYSVDLLQSTDYTMNVNAISSGYTTGTRDINETNATATEDFQLTITQACNAPGYASTGSGVSENFDSGSQPTGWTVIDNEGNNDVWTFTDPESQPNNTGGSGLFAVINSDFYGDGQSQDTELRSPVHDFSGQASVHLTFDTDFRYFGFPPEVGDVDVSNDGGANWTNVVRYQNGSTRGPHHEDIDISTIAGNQSNVMVRFHYYNATFEWWWQIDNVEIGVQCGPVTGGLIVGNVYDANTPGLGINGATVTSNNNPSDTTTTVSTPLDDNLDEGFFILFSSTTGNKKYTASKNLYGNDQHNVNVQADQVTLATFNLDAGKIVPSPNPLEATVDLGTTQTPTLTLDNQGAAAVDYELQEGKGNTNLPQGSKIGAPRKRIPGSYSPYFLNTKKKQTKADAERKADTDQAQENGTPLPDAPPWTSIHDYPISIMDNSCADIDEKIYCVGGYDGNNNLNSGYVYDPSSDTWSGIASMTGIREKPVVASIDGKLYVTGGWDNNGNPDGTLEIYDPSSDSWSTGATNPTPRAASSGVNLDGKFYVIGGCPTGFSCGATDTMVYDPSADTWTAVADFPELTSWTSCGAISGQIFCGGGVSDNG